jgi:putative ABC transport system permease protein
MAKWIAGWDVVRPDAWLALTTWCAAGVIGAGIGIWSGVRGSRSNLAAIIAEEGRTTHRASRSGRGLILALQASVAVVLLSAAALYRGGLSDVRTTFEGYDPDRVLLARMTAPAHRYAGETNVVSFFERVAGAAAATPGVRIVGLVQNAPASNVPNPVRGVWPTEDPPARGTLAPIADIQIADPRGLLALNVPLVSGRPFLDSDTASAPRVALVSRQLARRVWSNRDAIGRDLSVDDGSRWRVIGVVEDIRLNWYDGGPRPTLYLPHAQSAARSMTFILRSSGPPDALAGPLVAAARRVEPDPPPFRAYTLRTEVDDSLAPLLTLSWLLSALATVALALATGGVYGLAASASAMRAREMGIRMVLGAPPGSLARLILQAVARPVGLGCVVGVLAAMGLARWLGSHTFGLLTLDATVPIAIAAFLMAAAALGAWSPARRAARVDPIVTLRG